MKDIINCTVKTVLDSKTAIVKIVSYGYYNEYDFENREELTICFSNLTDKNALNKIGDKPLQIVVESMPSSINNPINAKGQLIQLVDSEIFLK